MAKAVRGAVTEARKNMQTMHYEPGPRVAAPKQTPSPSATKMPTATELSLEKKIRILGERNQALASALGDALQDLRTQLDTMMEPGSPLNETVHQTLARAESVQSCLKDPSLSLLAVTTPKISGAEGETIEPAAATPPPPAIPPALNGPAGETQTDPQDTPQHHADASGPSIESGTSGPVGIAISRAKSANAAGLSDGERNGLRSNARPSLADAGFSWMLGGSQNHLSTFVSSASVTPEQTRHQEQPRQKGSPLFGTGGEDQKPGTCAESDELAMRSLRGSRRPL